MNGKTKVTLAAATALALSAAVPAFAQDSNTLRVGMYSKSVPRGNVYAIQNIWPSMYWWEAVFDSVVRINDKAQIEPMVAERWELKNPTTWHLTLRKDIVFSSGRTSDAANMVKMFDYLSTDKGLVTNIMQTVKIASYRAVDAQTVEFVTKEPDPLFVAKLAQFYVGDLTAFNEMGPEAFGSKPVASGPFLPTSWTDSEMVGVANPRTWRKPKIANIRITELPEAASRLQALESAQIDVAINMGPDDIVRINATGNQAVIEPAPNVVSLALFTVDFANKWNMGGKTPFADRRVRQAVNYAVNREAMAKDFFKGIIKPAGQPATPLTVGFNPDVKPYPHDPAKAKQLLAEAGYPNGFSLIMEPVQNNIIGGREVLQIVAEDLGKVGIKTDINAMLFPAWSQLYNQKKWNGDMTTFSVILAPVMDASLPFAATYGCGHQRTFTCIDEMTPLINAAAVEMDPKKREGILRELMKKANEEAMSLLLFEGIDITGVGKRIKGYKGVNRVVHYDQMSIGG